MSVDCWNGEDAMVEKVVEIICRVFNNYTIKNQHQYRTILLDSTRFRTSVLDKHATISDIALTVYELVQIFNKHASTSLTTDIIQTVIKDSWELKKYFESELFRDTEYECSSTSST